jgi:hypothetical protein
MVLYHSLPGREIKWFFTTTSRGQKSNGYIYVFISALLRQFKSLPSRALMCLRAIFSNFEVIPSENFVFVLK